MHVLLQYDGASHLEFSLPPLALVMKLYFLQLAFSPTYATHVLFMRRSTKSLTVFTVGDNRQTRLELHLPYADTFSVTVFDALLLWDAPTYPWAAPADASLLSLWLADSHMQSAPVSDLSPSFWRRPHPFGLRSALRCTTSW